MDLLEFENVTVLRKGRRALDRLSLRIGVGENVAILGPNGSGKSTLVKLLTRELYPVAAEGPYRLRVLGRDSWELLDLRRHIGIVSTDLLGFFADALPVWEAVLSGFFGAAGLFINHRVTRVMETRTLRALELLEIAPLAGRPLGELSTGEARRVLIARALVHAPRALLLDEPANSLDLRAHREFRAVVRKLARSGTAILLVTHALEDLIPEIGRAVLLREGALFRDGPPDRVLSDANLSALYRMPVRVGRRNGYWFAR